MKYTLYRDFISDDVSIKPSGRCDAIEVETDEHAWLTYRIFSGCWLGVTDGEDYLSEWAENATDEKGNEYLITWRFQAIKGDEPDDDGWPWDDVRNIFNIEVVQPLKPPHPAASR